MRLGILTFAIISSLYSPAYAPPVTSASYIVTLDGEEMPGQPYESEVKCFVPRDFYAKETGGDARCIQIGAK